MDGDVTDDDVDADTDSAEETVEGVCPVVGFFQILIGFSSLLFQKLRAFLAVTTGVVALFRICAT